jgi:hypothetical protein
VFQTASARAHTKSHPVRPSPQKKEPKPRTLYHHKAQLPLPIGTSRAPSSHLLSNHLRWNLIASDNNKSNMSRTWHEVLINRRVRESNEVSLQETGITHKHRRSRHLQHRATSCRVGLLVTYIIVMFNYAIFSRMRTNRALPAPSSFLRFSSSLCNIRTLNYSRRLTVRLTGIATPVI